MSPEETRAKAPPTPPIGIAAGSPTTERAEPKFALENAAERKLEIAAPQLTDFFARLYFFRNRAKVGDFFAQSHRDFVDFLHPEVRLRW